MKSKHGLTKMNKILKYVGWAYLIAGSLIMAPVYLLTPDISLLGIVLLLFGWPFWLIMGYLSTLHIYPFGLAWFDWVEQLVFTKRSADIYLTSNLIAIMGLFMLSIGIVTIGQSIKIVCSILLAMIKKPKLN